MKNETVQIWHPINGEWINITQESDFQNNKRTYFTNGKQVDERTLNNDGTIQFHQNK